MSDETSLEDVGLTDGARCLQSELCEVSLSERNVVLVKERFELPEQSHELISCFSCHHHATETQRQLMFCRYVNIS